MRLIFISLLVGFWAELIDGAFGMMYGVIARGFLSLFSMNPLL
jgi:uncharacterized membrane protein YfcA